MMLWTRAAAHQMTVLRGVQDALILCIAADAAVTSIAAAVNTVLFLFSVYIAVTYTDAGSSDILHHLINASDLAEQVRLMRLVSVS